MLTTATTPTRPLTALLTTPDLAEGLVGSHCIKDAD